MGTKAERKYSENIIQENRIFGQSNQMQTVRYI